MNIKEKNAKVLDHVFGYTCANDIDNRIIIEPTLFPRHRGGGGGRFRNVLLPTGKARSSI
jgi:2-keto-4-pentenoate hydratase/2-oxohepta-3-ene-1,7-dioic acid hydratase in catechol pathway